MRSEICYIDHRAGAFERPGRGVSRNRFDAIGAGEEPLAAAGQRSCLGDQPDSERGQRDAMGLTVLCARAGYPPRGFGTVQLKLRKRYPGDLTNALAGNEGEL